MNNTLIASGPDFRSGWSDANAERQHRSRADDPLILRVKTTHPMDGRILREAMVDTHEHPTVTEKPWRRNVTLGGLIWRQHLRTATVDGVTYFLEGNGSSTPEHP